MGIKYLTRLRLVLSHLNDHKFRHNFQDCLDPLCPCSLEVKSTIHYFQHCQYYSDIRKTLLVIQVYQILKVYQILLMNI